jgi:ribosomal protein S18 acetylase RimI-like enzyme
MYTLRPIVDADFDFLFELHELALGDHVRAIWGWDPAFQLDFFRKGFRRVPASIVIVDGVDSGMVCIEHLADRVYLNGIELHPRVQRRGIGAALVRHVIEEAAGRGVPATLRVFKINVGARRLYQRLGFAIVGENETHYDMRYG